MLDIPGSFHTFSLKPYQLTASTLLDQDNVSALEALKKHPPTGTLVRLIRSV